MIIDNNIDVIVNVRNISKLRSSLENENIKIGQMINIPISLLSDGSHQIIKVECDICKNKKEIMYQKYIKNIKNGGMYCCSSKCAQLKVRNTSFEKFGAEHYSKTKEYKESVKSTSNIKYGEDHHAKSKVVKDKIKKTNIIKYGYENPFSNNEIKDKIKKTNLEKIGCENPSNNIDIKNKISKNVKISWLNKMKSYYDDLEIISYENSNYKINCVEGHVFIIENKLLNNRRQLGSKICTICNPIGSHSVSDQEIQIRDFIKSIYNFKIIENSRSIISPKEIDIYLPDIGLAIEYNGLYWHSDCRKDKNYHYMKMINCLNNGIELIQIWEDDWLYKRDIVKSNIMKKLNVLDKTYLDKYEIKYCSSIQSIEFLDKNDINGKVLSKYNIGCFINCELISIICLKKNKTGFEIVRYCDKIGLNTNSFELLIYFIKKELRSKIIINHDNSLGSSKSFEVAGLIKVGKISPRYKYIVNGIRRIKNNGNSLKIYDSGKTILEIKPL